MQKQSSPKASIITDTITLPYPRYEQSIYNPGTETSNFSYNYSNKWDIDGDKKNDSIYFIGNGGAHAYFFLRIILSSDEVVRDFPSVELGMPYFESKEALERWGKNPGLQFVVDDFGDDGIPDLYLNFDNPFGHVPKEWQKKGVRTKYVVISCAGNKLNVKDYFANESDAGQTY
jgi:hypothetical protein